jgi:hypothetical protein
LFRARIPATPGGGAIATPIATFVQRGPGGTPGIAIDFIEEEHAAVLRATRAGANPGNAALSTWVQDVECGDDAFRRVDHGRDRGDAASGLQEAIAVQRAVTVKAPPATAREPRSAAPRPAIRSLTGSAWTSPSAVSLDYPDLGIADLAASRLLAPGVRVVDECRVGMGDGGAREGAPGVFLPDSVMRLLRELPGEAVVIGPCHRLPALGVPQGCLPRAVR